MSIQLKTQLCQLLNIQYPILLAPMAGVPGVKLAAAVSNAGGLGSLGAAYMTPDAIRNTIRELRQMTSAPFGVNLFVTTLIDDNTRIKEAQQELNKIRGELGIAQAPGESVKTPNHFEEQFEVLVKEKVAVISTAFGLLPGQPPTSGKIGRYTRYCHGDDCQ